ncbi:origin recognition complex subunit 4 C-terminus-domain-containing protein [Mycena alexandri]|uniref:Origin recognition complex subunit 4 C-terminus-domain-containing protein n=1 Tax=Mycena alexandri TaxID=1745969 RepID=A0AAD6TIQ9_9AGAR|nr:origin recognition complex subunit 4 C-terminus-domain-containing protein [Mycena alexandri]
MPSPPPSPTKRVTRATRKSDDFAGDIHSATPSPTKRVTRATAKASPAKPSPLKASSPVKRRPPRARTPSPVPDSESESRDASPPVASSSRRASSPAIPHPEECTSAPSAGVLEIPVPLLSPNKLAPQNCLDAQKREILRAIQNPPDVVDDEESANRIAHKQLSDLLKGTVVRGEGNSCLLLGPRGSGKTRILNQCISELSEPPIVLRLSGWSQQSDRLAMREIAYQLSQQTGRSFLAAADDDEAADEADDDEPNPFLDTTTVTTSLPPSAHLPALISTLPTLSRPTVVVLDAFDLFAQHPRQSLLYCLLDTAQSCRGGASSKGVAVIGLTTHVDTINLLEKRVKSRFSGRMLRTASPSQSQDWVELTRGILCSRIAELDETGDWQRQWEAGVHSFLQDKATIVVLKETFSVTKDVRVLARLLTSVATQLSPSAAFPTSAQLVSAAATQRSRPRFSMLHALPYPSLCLLIACVHASTAGHPIFTFEMLHEKVRDQIRLSASAPVEVNGGSIGMPQCPRTAFETLVAAKLFTPTAAPSASLGKEFVKFRAEVSREDVKRAVQTRGDINLTKWLTKATQ